MPTSRDPLRPPSYLLSAAGHVTYPALLLTSAFWNISSLQTFSFGLIFSISYLCDLYLLFVCSSKASIHLLYYFDICHLFDLPSFSASFRYRFRLSFLRGRLLSTQWVVVLFGNYAMILLDHNVTDMGYIDLSLFCSFVLLNEKN
ncbi:hypothetical protein BDZ97DRAFT_1039993 [Flammula alnicola]|nr:hypothetical protein BDZ97DRAFT_1039993 [Flammula alnicola]